MTFDPNNKVKTTFKETKTWEVPGSSGYLRITHHIDGKVLNDQHFTIQCSQGGGMRNDATVACVTVDAETMRQLCLQILASLPKKPVYRDVRGQQILPPGTQYGAE